MKEIPLAHGKVALVDDADYAFLSQWRWSVVKPTRARVSYVVRHARVNGKRRSYRMHQVLVAVPIGKEIDHVNGNGLDNRRENLRVCDKSQNKCNRGPHADNLLGVKGVYRHRGKWGAHIRYRGQNFYLGLHLTMQDAALAYDKAAKVVHREFAWTNAEHGLI